MNVNAVKVILKGKVHFMMELRRAVMDDLPQIRAVYKEICRDMDRNGIQIWDEIYPGEAFGEDIENHRLYVLTQQKEIVSAFALCDSNSGAGCVKWENQNERAFYLDRLGVNVNYKRKGIGSLALQKATALAGSLGAGYLRLFVVDINQPAINLYLKNGFTKADGIYDEVIDEDLVLHEFGYEKKTTI